MKSLNLFLALILVCFSACATLAKKTAYPSEVDSTMKAAFSRADADYYNKKYDSALAAYQKYLADYPYNALADEARYKMGKIEFIKKNWEGAIQQFEILSAKSPDAVYRSKGRFMAGYTAFEAGQIERASAYLAKARPDKLPAVLAIQHYSLLIQIGEKNGNAADAQYALLGLADAYSQSSDLSLGAQGGKYSLSRAEVKKRLGQWINVSMDASAIPSWMISYPRGYGRAYVDYKLGKTYFEGGNTAKAEKYLLAVVNEAPKNEYADSARTLLEKMGSASKAGAFEILKVGVLLPLTGPQAAFGESALRGIQCANGETEGCALELKDIVSGGPSIKLIVRDSGASPEAIPGLVDELAGEGAKAIIGPMSAALAEAAAKKAQSSKIVLMAITQKTDLMQLGDYVFQMGYEADQQADDLVQKATARQLKNFGIFYPDNNYGKELAANFEEAVKKAGGQIMAKAAYVNKPDMTGEVRKLRLNTTHYSFDGTSAGFDALFIPDSYAMVNRIVGSLPNVNIRAIPLLGTNAWNDASLSTEIPQSYPGSFFVDVFFAGSSKPLSQQFARGYASSYSRAPSSIDALGFDALCYIRQASRQAGDLKSASIKDALLSIRSLEGVTGITNFVAKEGPEVSPLILISGSSGIEVAP